MYRDDIDWTSINAVSQYIHDWANSAFPGRQPKAALTKLVMDEIPEMLTELKENGPSGIGGELADCFILLMDLAVIWQVDLPRAIRDKMALNEKRTWVKDEELGHYQHAEEVLYGFAPSPEQSFQGPGIHEIVGEGVVTRRIFAEPACACDDRKALHFVSKCYCENCGGRIHDDR